MSLRDQAVRTDFATSAATCVVLCIVDSSSTWPSRPFGIRVMDEQHLIEKLRRIETLFEGASFDGERIAARQAADRVQERLDATRSQELIEFRFSLPDAWSKALFIALLRRRGIDPYRYSGLRRTTVMARASKSLINEEIWPEFEELHKTLDSYLRDVTGRVIATAIHGGIVNLIGSG